MNIQYAIVFVSDMQQAIEFYRDVIGLPSRFESPEWTEFATAGAKLAQYEGPDGLIFSVGESRASA